MTIKERRMQELEHTPDILLEQVFNFLRFLKSTYFSGNLPQTAEPSVASQPTPQPPTLSKLSETKRLELLNQLFGAWANQPDLDEIFAQIERDRHTYQGRQIDSLDG